MDSYSNVTNAQCHEIRDGIAEKIDALETRVTALEGRMAKKDTEFAVINTKLTAILWGVGVLATAIIGVLVKLVFNVA